MELLGVENIYEMYLRKIWRIYSIFLEERIVMFLSIWRWVCVLKMESEFE